MAHCTYRLWADVEETRSREFVIRAAPAWGCSMRTSSAMFTWLGAWAAFLWNGLWFHIEPNSFPLAEFLKCGFSACVGGHGRLPVPTPWLWLAVQCGQTDM